MRRETGDGRREHGHAMLPVPAHVAMIMDGNGRWAKQRGKPRTFGHIEGARTVRRIVEHARRSGVRYLTLYAFSSDNWSRPADEVHALMKLFRRHLASETPKLLENDIRLSVVGRRDRLSPELVRAIEAAERETSDCDGMCLRLAVDYSSRDTLVRAAAILPQGASLSRDDFARAVSLVNHCPGGVPDVDLMVRTGGEQRMSDFLLWECAYAELVFSRRMWPDFSNADFDDAVADFYARDRRFGGLSKAI